MNPVFADIVNLLDTLANGNGDSAPHHAFWQGTTRDIFVAMQTDPWGEPGPLVTVGNPQTSNLYLALAGLSPFDGSGLPQMPDVNQAPTSRYATPDELNLVSKWITTGAP
jgi:hypothetical protein